MEAKLGLFIIMILVGAFSFLVYRRFDLHSRQLSIAAAAPEELLNLEDAPPFESDSESEILQQKAAFTNSDIRTADGQSLRKEESNTTADDFAVQLDDELIADATRTEPEPDWSALDRGQNHGSVSGADTDVEYLKSGEVGPGESLVSEFPSVEVAQSDGNGRNTTSARNADPFPAFDQPSDERELSDFDSVEVDSGELASALPNDVNAEPSRLPSFDEASGSDAGTVAAALRKSTSASGIPEFHPDPGQDELHPSEDGRWSVARADPESALVRQPFPELEPTMEPHRPDPDLDLPIRFPEEWPDSEPVLATPDEPTTRNSRDVTARATRAPKRAAGGPLSAVPETTDDSRTADDILPDSGFSSGDVRNPEVTAQRLAPQLSLPTGPQFRLDDYAGENQVVPASSEEVYDVYTVRKGDNYWRISRQLYGTGRYFSALAGYNESRIADPRALLPGMKVLIPPAEILEKRYRELFPRVLQYEKLPAGYFVQSDGGAAYRIGERDTLSEIAKKHLGRSSRWIEIYRINRAVLKNPNRLKPGTVIILPDYATDVHLVP